MKALEKDTVVIWTLVIALIILGHFLFAQFADYAYLSDSHVRDIFLAKLWSLGWMTIAGLFLYWKRKSKIAAPLSIWALSAYFVVLYAIMFHGTEFGLNGLWGDNFYRLSMVNKSYHFGGFPDALQKGLPSLYPPLWFYTMALYAKTIGIEPYQTVKYGYLFVFLLYPWALFYSWKRILPASASAAVTIAVIFLGHHYLNYLYYEHITAALFLPWWLYYIEGAEPVSGKLTSIWIKRAVGALIGGLLFMTYYWWFFMAAAALPLSAVLRYFESRDRGVVVSYFRETFLILSGVGLLSAPFWMPLMVVGFQRGVNSTQSSWFRMTYANIGARWSTTTLEGILTFLGIVAAFVLWRKWKYARIGILLLGGFVLILFDRLANISGFSIQTRKFLEFMHVFALSPLAIVVYDVLKEKKLSQLARNGALVTIALFVLGTANEHTEIYNGNLYTTGLKQRVPQANLDLINTVEAAGKVFVTNAYVEACFIPYFVFIPTSHVHTNLAGEFEPRKVFLKLAGAIDDPELLSYALNYNRFDRIDFLYLPRNSVLDAYALQVTSVPFNQATVFDTILFSAPAFRDTSYFASLVWKGPIEVKPIPVDTLVEARLLLEYPGMRKFVGRLGEGVNFRDVAFGDNNALDDVATLVDISIENNGERDVAIGFNVLPQRTPSRELRFFLHFYPEGNGGMINRDFSATKPITSWKPKMLVSVRRALDLSPGRYQVAMGMFSGDETIGKPINFNLVVR